MSFSPEQQKRIDQLCRMISEEKDHSQIKDLARELNELLAEKTGTATAPKMP